MAASSLRWISVARCHKVTSISTSSLFSTSSSSLVIGVSALLAAASSNPPNHVDDAPPSRLASPTIPREPIWGRFLVPRTTLCDAAPYSTEPVTPNKLPSAKLQRKMTAIGHFAVASETVWNPSIITFALQLQGAPLSQEEFTTLWHQAEMPQRHPRFHQRLVPSRRYGWQLVDETPLTLNHHVTETVYPHDRGDLRSRLQRMQMNVWNYQDSLWYLTIASQGVTRPTVDGGASTPTLLLFRGHHALADGASMAAALADLFDEASHLRSLTAHSVASRRRKGHTHRSWWHRWWRAWTQLVQFVIGSLQSLRYQVTLWWHDCWDVNPWKQLQRLAHPARQDASPVYRTLSWSEVAPVHQVKWVADVLGKTRNVSITINDVFVACVTAALARQLQHHRQRLWEVNDDSTTPTIRPLPKQECIHVAVPVHLKGGVILPGESVGNNIGAFVVRVPGENVGPTEGNECDSVNRLYAVSQELSIAKQTPTAILSHLLAKSLSYATSIVPVSWISKLYAASNAGSLVVVSNNRSAPIPVHLAGRRVESIYGFVPLPPGIPVGVTVTSYAGNLSCTLTAEPWAVPDGDQFMVWVLEEYMSLLAAAKRKS